MTHGPDTEALAEGRDLAARTSTSVRPAGRSPAHGWPGSPAAALPPLTSSPYLPVPLRVSPGWEKCPGRVSRNVRQCPRRGGLPSSGNVWKLYDVVPWTWDGFRAHVWANCEMGRAVAIHFNEVTDVALLLVATL